LAPASPPISSCQTLGDRESKTGAAVLAGGGGIGLFECMEQTGEFFGSDADAGILNLEAHQQSLATVFEEDRAQADGCPGR
jgi:hypothetical protein